MKLRKATCHKISFRTFFIINIPVFLFSLGCFLFVTVGLYTTNIISGLSFILSWWHFCGMIMLTIDYPRKYNHFKKLLNISLKKNSTILPQPLKSTLCGLCIYFALLTRLKHIQNKG